MGTCVIVSQRRSPRADVHYNHRMITGLDPKTYWLLEMYLPQAPAIITVLISVQLNRKINV